MEDAAVTELYKMGPEVAEQEFVRFAEALGLIPKIEAAEDDDKKELLKHKETFLDAVQRGFLEVDDKGQAVLRPRFSGGDPITFFAPKMSILRSLRETETMTMQEASFRGIAKLTKQPFKRIDDLHLYDGGICLAVFALFLALL